MTHSNELQGRVQYATRRGAIGCLGGGKRYGLAGLLWVWVLLGLQMAPAQGADLAYIANGGSDNLSVIDTATQSVIATLPVGSLPTGLAVNSAAARVYVANLGSNSVSVIDTATQSVIATLPVGSLPAGVAVNPTGTRAYVANFGSDNVSVIDTATQSVIATVPVGDAPTGVAVNPTGTRAYVSNFGSNNVSVINTANQSFLGTIPVGSGPFGLAVNPAGTRVYVANRGGNSVSVIDAATETVVTTLPAGSAPRAFGQVIAPVQSPPGLTFSFTGCLTCSAGDRFTVEVRIVNPGTTEVPTEMKIGVRLPSGVPVNLMGKHLEVTLAAGQDRTVTVLDITLPAGLPPGTWTFEGALLEPELGATLSRSARFFDVVP
jgi:YVTN family beta-propeller protein